MNKEQNQNPQETTAQEKIMFFSENHPVLSKIITLAMSIGFAFIVLFVFKYWIL